MHGTIPILTSFLEPQPTFCSTVLFSGHSKRSDSCTRADNSKNSYNVLCSENQTNRPYLEFVTIDFSIFLVTDASSGDSNGAQGGSFNQIEIFLFLKFSEFCLKLFEFFEILR